MTAADRRLIIEDIHNTLATASFIGGKDAIAAVIPGLLDGHFQTLRVKSRAGVMGTGEKEIARMLADAASDFIDMELGHRLLVRHYVKATYERLRWDGKANLMRETQSPVFEVSDLDRWVEAS